ncbi:MAG: peptide-methionine (R)-S-oxide reductase MsrB [Spirochaetia bacterium]|nr:peptide-methionine (R)-S-oxide reductase MsrB [Spirochaetia bacterium]
MDHQSKSEEEWKNLLTPEQFKILRKCGTDLPFTNKYYNNHETGKYHCAGCGSFLFDSNEKFDSGSGWPSFTSPAHQNAIRFIEDNSHGMHRIEVQCANCGGHLGHVFDDGPEPTFKRYCINSTSLDFKGT